MRVAAERLAGMRKDSEASRAADVRPNWPGRGRFSGDPALQCASAYLKASQRRNRDARYIVQEQSPRQIRPPDRQAGATNSEATSTTKATEPARRRRYKFRGNFSHKGDGAGETPALQIQRQLQPQRQQRRRDAGATKSGARRCRVFCADCTGTQTAAACARVVPAAACTNGQLSSSGNRCCGTPAWNLGAPYNLGSDLLRPLGTWETLQMLGWEAGRAALRGEAYGAEGDGHPCREPAG